MVQYKTVRAVGTLVSSLHSLLSLQTAAAAHLKVQRHALGALAGSNVLAPAVAARACRQARLTRA